MRRLTDLLEQAKEPRPLLERLDQLEAERQRAAERVLRAEDAQDRVKVLAAVTEEEVAATMAEVAATLAELDRDALKDVLRAWIDRIVLDPATRTGRVDYRLSISRDKVASPRRHGANPPILASGAGFDVPRRRPGPQSRHAPRPGPA